MFRLTCLSAIVVALLLLLGAVAAQATDYTFVPGGTNDWWMTTANWSPNGVPNSTGDVAIFDASVDPSYTTNVHSQYYVVQELRFATTSNWTVHNGRQDPTLQAPSGTALITQNGSGTVTFTTDLVFNSSTVFGGSGSGNITVNGSSVGAYQGTVRGAGGLTMSGNYTLTINAPVSYQGPTTIDSGTLLINGDSLTTVAGGDNSTSGYTPIALAPITVHAGGTLGGVGHLLADVTVNGGTFTPGSPNSTPSASRMSLSNLELLTGSTAEFELAGASAGNPGSGAGYYDQVEVTGQLSLGGTLDVSLVGGYAPPAVGTYAIFTYGSLNPSASTFDVVNLPTYAPAAHPNWSWSLDYGSGTNDQVTLSLDANPWYYTGDSYDPGYTGATNPYWATYANWNYNGKPGFDSANPDVVIFDDTHLNLNAPHETNIHDVNPAWLQELRVDTASSWHFYNNDRTLVMKSIVSGQPALFTQNGSGTVLVDDDIRLDSDTVFGGTGTGAVTVNGYYFAGRRGIYGSGSLTKQGAYDLVVNNTAGWTGTTTIEDGRLVFNATSSATQGTVTVADGGTLGGTGVLHAPVVVQSGGILSPGQSPGVLTVDSLTLEPGAVATFELGGASPGNGSGFHDQVIVIDQLSLAGTLDVQLVGGFEPSLYQSFVLFQYGTLDPLHAEFDAIPIGYAVRYGTGVNSAVVLTAVPEPSTWVLLGLGALTGLVGAAWRRRRV